MDMSVAYKISILDKLCTRTGISSVPQEYKYRTQHPFMGLSI